MQIEVPTRKLVRMQRLRDKICLDRLRKLKSNVLPGPAISLGELCVRPTFVQLDFFSFHIAKDALVRR
jgi:hypothetical protein